MDDEKSQKVKKDIKKISTPETLKRNLINASLILTAYELMKYSLINRVKDFFEIDKEHIPESYSEHKNEIEQIRKKLPKKLRKIPLLVYAYWFKEHEALTDTDFNNIVEIRRYRNEVAHELIKFLVDSDFEVELKCLFQIRDIVEKADIWWIQELEIPINPDFDQVKIKDGDIRSGRMIILDHIISIACELKPGIEENKSGLVH
jgi:hypothetical protein